MSASPEAEATFQDLKTRWNQIETQSLYYRPDKTLRYLETYPKTVSAQVESWAKFRDAWLAGKQDTSKLQSQAADLYYVQASIDEANRRILGLRPQVAACLKLKLQPGKSVYDDPELARGCGIWWRPPGAPKSVDVVSANETLVLLDAIDKAAPSVQSLTDEVSRAVGEELGRGGSRAGAAALESFWKKLSPLAKAGVVGLGGLTAAGLIGFSVAQIRALLPPSRR